MAEFASTAVGNAGLATGIIGTALGVLNGGGNLLGIHGIGAPSAPSCSENMPITRYDAQLINQLAVKDSELALARSEIATNDKIITATREILSRVKAVEDEVRANAKEQSLINQNQAVYNGVANASISVLQSQVAQLMGLTKLVVPNGSVCPGWGNVTITPATPATTA